MEDANEGLGGVTLTSGNYISRDEFNKTIEDLKAFMMDIVRLSGKPIDNVAETSKAAVEVALTKESPSTTEESDATPNPSQRKNCSGTYSTMPPPESYGPP